MTPSTWMSTSPVGVLVKVRMSSEQLTCSSSTLPLHWFGVSYSSYGNVNTSPLNSMFKSPTNFAGSSCTLMGLL